MIDIRVFKAVNDRPSSLKYADAHREVLKGVGVENIIAPDLSWIDNHKVFVIVVESHDTKEVLGGAKIQIAGDDSILPIEEAVGKLDPKITDLINYEKKSGTGEFCGLWNSRKVAGLGIGSIFLVRAGVAKAGVAIANQLELNSLFALCAKWTVKISQKAGFEIVENVGENGTFKYPKDDLRSVVTLLKDIHKLEKAEEQEKKEILSLRENPLQTRIEKGPRGQVEVHYNLIIPKIEY